MPARGQDVRQLLLQVDASVALAQRNVNQLANAVARDSGRMNQSLASVDTTMSRLGTGIGRLNSAMGTIGLSLGAGALIDAGRSILQFSDELDAAASQAGISVERYQTLREALRALEIPAQSADRIFRQLQSTARSPALPDSSEAKSRFTDSVV